MAVLIVAATLIGLPTALYTLYKAGGYAERIGERAEQTRQTLDRTLVTTTFVLKVSAMLLAVYAASVIHHQLTSERTKGSWTNDLITFVESYVLPFLYVFFFVLAIVLMIELIKELRHL